MHYPQYNHRQIRSIFENAERLGLSRAARLRLTWFLFAIAHEWNVSKTCRHFGIARSTFIRWMDRFDPRIPDSLEEHDRRPHRVREAKEDPAVVAYIEQSRRTDPYVNKEVISARLLAERGIAVSASTVGRIIQRHGFFFGSTRAHQMKRSQCDGVPDFDSPSTMPALRDPLDGGEPGAASFDGVPSFGI